MAENKTQPTDTDVSEFLASVAHKTRAADAQVLLRLFSKITGWPAVMWAPSIVGFGRYRYKYDSGREGTHLVTGFSPRKASMSVYIMPGYRDLSAPLSRLGKHKIGKSCLYINKLADVDMDALEEIIRNGTAYMTENYEVTAT